jgi:hypothetical protein
MPLAGKGVRGKGRSPLPRLSTLNPRSACSALRLMVWQHIDMVDKERSRDIRRHIRRILMAEWDPIGVSDIPEAADEYDSYIGGVYELLERGSSQTSIYTYLRNIEVDQMELVDASRQPLLPESKRNAVASSLEGLGHYFTEASK